MSRTYRRKSARYEYGWVLREWTFEAGHLQRLELDRDSSEGRRRIARFHSDACVMMRSGPPRWFRRHFKRRHRNADTRELRKWLNDPGYDSLLNARHRHSARWAWW
jgi:hypothetical protein